MMSKVTLILYMGSKKKHGVWGRLLKSQSSTLLSSGVLPRSAENVARLCQSRQWSPVTTQMMTKSCTTEADVTAVQSPPLCDVTLRWPEAGYRHRHGFNAICWTLSATQPPLRHQEEPGASLRSV